MKVLIAYGTTDGQTRKVARFCAYRLTEEGYSVELLPADDGDDIDPALYDAALIAGSVHAGGYQKPLVAFAERHADHLAAMPAAFLSVSLTAAGDDPDDWKGLEDVVAQFGEKTGWSPDPVIHVAGAFRFLEYDFFKSWAMRWIAAQKKMDIDPHVDTEFTDWNKLGRDVDDWLNGVAEKAA